MYINICSRQQKNNLTRELKNFRTITSAIDIFKFFQENVNSKTVHVIINSSEQINFQPEESFIWSKRTLGYSYIHSIFVLYFRLIKDYDFLAIIVL